MTNRIYDLKFMAPVFVKGYGHGHFVGFLSDGLFCQVAVLRSLEHASDEELFKYFHYLDKVADKDLPNALADCRKQSVQANPIVMTSDLSIETASEIKRSPAHLIPTGIVS